MTRNNLKTVELMQPTPEPIEAASPATPVPAPASIPNSFVNIGGEMGRLQTEREEGIALKKVTMQQARQWLAQSHDLSLQGAGKETEAAELADRATGALFDINVNASVSLEEITGAIKDVYGCKMKGKGNEKLSVPIGHPEASKTPAGRGDAIRKRIVRLSQATEYVNDPDKGSAFFVALPVDKVDEILLAVNRGSLSPWSAYEKMTELKSKAKNGATPLAFDVKRLAEITNTLQQAGSPLVAVQNKALKLAYTDLLMAIILLNNEVTRIIETGEHETDTND